jgi:hypothetical protein
MSLPIEGLILRMYMHVSPHNATADLELLGSLAHSSTSCAYINFNAECGINKTDVDTEPIVADKLLSTTANQFIEFLLQRLFDNR